MSFVDVSTTSNFLNSSSVSNGEEDENKIVGEDAMNRGEDRPDEIHNSNVERVDDDDDDEVKIVEEEDAVGIDTALGEEVSTTILASIPEGPQSSSSSVGGGEQQLRQTPPPPLSPPSSSSREDERNETNQYKMDFQPFKTPPTSPTSPPSIDLRDVGDEVVPSTPPLRPSATATKAITTTLPNPSTPLASSIIPPKLPSPRHPLHVLMTAIAHELEMLVEAEEAPSSPPPQRRSEDDDEVKAIDKTIREEGEEASKQQPWVYPSPFVGVPPISIQVCDPDEVGALVLLIAQASSHTRLTHHDAIYVCNNQLWAFVEPHLVKRVRRAHNGG